MDIKSSRMYDRMIELEKVPYISSNDKVYIKKFIKRYNLSSDGSYVPYTDKQLSFGEDILRRYEPKTVAVIATFERAAEYIRRQPKTNKSYIPISKIDHVYGRVFSEYVDLMDKRLYTRLHLIDEVKIRIR